MNRLLIQQISLAIATLFLILSVFTKNFWLILIGLSMIVYSSNQIKKLKG